MLNREIPFRPKLEGDFRVRFYNAVSCISEETSPIEIERISNGEIMWVEKECIYNLEQRKTYRAVWMLFRDLTRASWKACYRDGVLYMSLPSLNGADMHNVSSPEVKKLLRSWMSESRHERLVTYTDFIQRMEHRNSSNHDISELIADGAELAGRLERAHNSKIELSEAVSPYLQLVIENERDEFTGIKTSEIWRYFRLTWSTPAETTPGRTMQYLIRDAAHPMHAVMGIASLENCAVQITCRDDYIGWNQKAFIDRITMLDSAEAKGEFEKLLQYLEIGIDGIDYSALCTEPTVKNPSDEDIQQLLDYANSAEQRRQELLKEALIDGIEEDDKSELGSISRETEEALYRRKRAEQLARLLIAKKALLEVYHSADFGDIWVDFCKSENGNSAIRTALVAQKTQHIGSSLMELNVCGAIPPYNEILGGKLVALLATSPQVIHDYKERYSNKASMIASRLKGQDVFRPADLVYVGTTSLYYVGSSQYNRLRIPGSVFGSDFDVVWKKLGMTIGFGTMHISKATTLSLTEATSDGFSRINHVFGEGASPKMRLLTMSIRELLESTNEDSKDFSKHAMSRIVYGVCLATNTLDYLMGKDTSPKYYTDVNHYQEGTQKIIDYWTTRWLSSRLNFAPIYERIRGFDKGSFMVGNQIKDSEPRPFVKLKEVSHMPVNDEKKVGLQFIRDFYRGSSAYADHVDEELLSYIHLTTKLDAAIIKAVEDGNNYQPVASIPIGEMQYDKRMVNVWAADNSRIISQYLTLLRGYNLYPKAETLIEILRQFGHVASNGLISIPKFGSDAQAVDNKKKGLIGTLFAASWYMKQHDDALVASLDDDKARLWLQNSKYGNERADLVGLYYDEASNTLHIEPIEVKTRDESPDATITRDESDSKSFLITGHAAGQIASMIEILREIFTADDNQMDMFTSARREVLKYQIVSECFRNVHDSDWQKKWYLILKRAFSSESEGGVNIVVSGLLLHIKLNEAVGGDHISCTNPDFDNCRIDYWKLTAKEIQCDILGEGTLIKETVTPDFDESEDSTLEENGVEDAIIDIDMDAPAEPSITSQQENSTVYTSPTITPSDLPKVAEKTIPYRQNEEPSDTVSPVAPENSNNDVSRNEIEQLVKDFKRSCGDYHVSLKECNSEDTVVGPSVIRLKFRLGRGQSLQGLSSHLEDIGREMKRTGVIIQQVPNSDELLLDVPRLKREKVLFKNVIASLPHVTSPEQLYFPLGRTPNGEDLIEDLGQMPHMLVGGSTGSGKSVFLFTMLAAMLMTHPSQDELKLVLSSSKLEDFIHFEGLPHLYSGGVISDAIEATRVIKDVIFEESERRGKLLAEARVANITEYNRIASKKLAPIVVVIDEFADLADQLETKKEQNAFYKPVQRIAQAGRSRGIHLVICTQRPEAKLVPSTTKAQLNGRVALRVNDGISSRMIIETPDAQYLQKHGDMIYKNGDIVERAQGYLIEIPELDEIVKAVINRKQ